MSVPFRGGFGQPSLEEQFTARPVVGPTLASHATALNHLAGVRSRKWHTAHVGQYAQTVVANQQGFVSDQMTEGVNQTAYVLLSVGALDTALELALLTSSLVADYSLTPTVELTLQTLAGATVDRGIIFSRADNSLQADVRGYSANRYRIMPTWSRSGVTRRPGLATGLVKTQPRAIETDTTGGSLLLSRGLLRIDTTSAIVHAVAWCPVWGETL
jgi:hypothetical protein